MPRELIYNRELLSYINDVKWAFRSNPIVLGGTTGSGGGSGGPPGGFVGQLTQRQVAGDTTESSIYTTGSMGSLLDNLNNIRAYSLPAKDFFATQTYPVSNTLMVMAGEWFHTDGQPPLVYAGGTSPTVTAPVGGSRYDLLTINTTGDLAWISGSVAVSPSLPSFPSATAGILPLWAVYSRTSGSVIKNVDDGTNHYIQHDYRPFIGGPTVFPTSGSAYAVYRWQIDGPLTAANDFNGVYYIPGDYDLTESVEWLKIPPSSGSVIVDIQYSTNSGSTWTSIYSTLPTLTSGSFLSHAPLSITLSAGTLVKANINNPGVGASTISLNLIGTVKAAAGVGTVGSVSVNASDGIIGSVTNPSTAPVINLHLADITPDSIVSSGSISGINLSGINTGDQSIVLTGDVTGSGTGAITTALSITGVTPGWYYNTNLEVDQDGRILNATTGSGGSNILKWFNVEDYGADPTGSADSTAAIQDAIDAADAANGGTIYFPTEGGIYKIAGALQDTSHANCQLLMPSRGLDDGEITIRFKGPGRPSFMWNTVDPMPAQTGGVATLKGTLTGQTGTACMFGAYGPATGGIFAGADYITVIFEDLMFEMPPNPSYTCIDSSNFGAAFLGVQIHCSEWDVSAMTEPTHTNAYGVKMTLNNLQGYTHAQGLAVFGFYKGIRLTEFTNADGLRVMGCIYGYEIPAMHHPIVIQSAGYYDCVYGILADGEARLTIQNLDIERANHVTAPAWCWSVKDVEDPGNDLYGFLSWISVQGGVGNDHAFTKNGGAYLQCIEMDTFLGDVTGPASAADDRIATFNGTSGKLLQDGGYTISTLLALIAAGTGSEVLMADGITPPDPLTTEDETDWLYSG